MQRSLLIPNTVTEYAVQRSLLIPNMVTAYAVQRSLFIPSTVIEYPVQRSLLIPYTVTAYPMQSVCLFVCLRSNVPPYLYGLFPDCLKVKLFSYCCYRSFEQGHTIDLGIPGPIFSYLDLFE